MSLLKLAALGAAAYYFFDPKNGAERRANVKNKLSDMMKKGSSGNQSDTGMGRSGSSASGSGSASDPDLVVVDQHGIQSHTHPGQM